MYTGRTYRSSHKSKVAARAAGQKLAEVAGSVLGRTSRPASRPTLKFQGIRHRIRKNGQWAFEGVVRRPRSRKKVYLGVSADIREVAEWVAEFHGKR